MWYWYIAIYIISKIRNNKSVALKNKREINEVPKNKIIKNILRTNIIKKTTNLILSVHIFTKIGLFSFSFFIPAKSKI